MEKKFLKIKKNSGGNFVIKLKPKEEEDYWTFHHYKMTEIKDVEPKQRYYYKYLSFYLQLILICTKIVWKKSEFLLKIPTNSKKKEDDII